jgi:hypothetical protein
MVGWRVRPAGVTADSRLEPLVLSEDERRVLENWAKRRSTAQGLALRARIVLACADGGSNTAVAAWLRVARGITATWRVRFLAHPRLQLHFTPALLPMSLTSRVTASSITPVAPEIPHDHADPAGCVGTPDG